MSTKKKSVLNFIYVYTHIVYKISLYRKTTTSYLWPTKSFNIYVWYCGKIFKGAAKVKEDCWKKADIIACRLYSGRWTFVKGRHNPKT